MSARLGLFDAYGVEIEYAIVDAASLDVRPVADRLLEQVAGEPAADLERGPIAWSNELALHVLELKTNGPTTDLSALPSQLQENLDLAGDALRPLDCRLLPGGMHPWMDPARESKLWPHEYNEVYRAFDRIFGCSGHGWTNLQSAHLNLPFADDSEFHRLHAAIRLLLPLLPALAASSPVAEGRVGATLDRRLLEYMANSVRVPAVAGRIIPEPVASADDYQRVILDRVYEGLRPHDPEGVLRHEWANARGAIARFERGSIEIRLLDAQECANADVGLVAAVVDAVRWVAAEVYPTHADTVETAELAALLADTIRDGGAAELPDGELKRVLGLGSRARTAALAWSALLDRSAADSTYPPFSAFIERTLSRGPLARRIADELGDGPTRSRIEGVYRRMCDCLATGSAFE